MAGTELGPILASITCHYRRQLKYPDTVHVGTRVARLGRTNMAMEHVLYSQKQQATAADGVSTVVFFDYRAQRPVRIPSDLRSAVEQLEGKSFDHH
jgi:acyl-CoA thioester hydrolase